MCDANDLENKAWVRYGLPITDFIISEKITCKLDDGLEKCIIESDPDNESRLLITVFMTDDLANRLWGPRVNHAIFFIQACERKKCLDKASVAVGLRLRLAIVADVLWGLSLNYAIA